MLKTNDCKISQRAYEVFINWVCDKDLTIKKASELLGIGRKTPYSWYEQRNSPNANVLQAMYEQGLDVIYILTGKKSHN